MRKRWIHRAWLGVDWLLEIMQGFTGRDPSVFDWLIDTGGALLGAGLTRAWLARVYARASGCEQGLAGKPAAG